MSPISIAPEVIFHIGSFPVTNTLLASWVAVILLIIFAWIVSAQVKKNRRVPGMIQNAAESALDMFLDFMSNIAGDRATAERFMPIVGAIFFLILFSNWIGILPGVGSIGHYVIEGGKQVFIPYLRSANSDINMTLALALIVVTLSHIIGLAVIGVKRHMEKFFRLTGPIDFAVGILEIVSEFAKVVSLSFRLFGNVFAGEVLIAIITFLVPYAVPVPFLALEVFVGFIQALIFATLTMMYLASATHIHGTEHEDELHDA